MEFRLKLFCYLLAKIWVEKTFEITDVNKNVRLFGFNSILPSLTSVIV